MVLTTPNVFSKMWVFRILDKRNCELQRIDIETKWDCWLCCHTSFMLKKRCQLKSAHGIPSAALFHFESKNDLEQELQGNAFLFGRGGGAKIEFKENVFILWTLLVNYCTILSPASCFFFSIWKPWKWIMFKEAGSLSYLILMQQNLIVPDTLSVLLEFKARKFSECWRKYRHRKFW